MSKLELQAIFERKANNFQTAGCVVEQIIRLPGREFDFFKDNLIRDYDFIRDNVESMYVDNNKTHCLLVVGEDRKDGVLVESSGSATTQRHNTFSDQLKVLEGKLTANAELQKQITTYAKTRAAYLEYRKSGYSNICTKKAKSKRSQAMNCGRGR